MCFPPGVFIENVACPQNVSSRFPKFVDIAKLLAPIAVVYSMRYVRLGACFLPSGKGAGANPTNKRPPTHGRLAENLSDEHTFVRVLTANGASLGDALADVLSDANPTIAAITSLTPAQACAIAARLSLRYAIQCWDTPQAGKAILWKPVVPLQALYRAEFGNRKGQTAGIDQRGLLRVTLLWDGRPLSVYCTEFANDPRDADWQMVQVARELEAVKDATIIAAGPDRRLPAWPGLTDAIAAARWRSIAYPAGKDLSDAARAAFGVATAVKSTSSAADEPGGLVRLLCSGDFSVVRVSQTANSNAPGAVGPLIVDLAPASNGDDATGLGISAAFARRGTFAQRTSTYPA
jgi:hypothetical protein